MNTTNLQVLLGYALPYRNALLFCSLLMVAESAAALAHLLMRIHEPGAGRILIDGTDIAKVNLYSLRRQIGVVPQHVLLFNGTARDNIAYGHPDPSQEAIEAAARAARAHDFIVKLPQGYDTFIGDRGVRLSGGQQQRLALADRVVQLGDGKLSNAPQVRVL